MEGLTVNHKLQGISLIELVISMAVTAVLFGVALPSLSGLVVDARVRSTLHLLGTDMTLARSSAIARNTQVVVCPRTVDNRCRADGNWRDGWIVFLDPDRDRQPGQDMDILSIRNASIHPRHALLSSRPFLRYRSDGASTGTNLTVRMCTDQRLSASVVVNNQGRIRTERAGKPPPPPCA